MDQKGPKMVFLYQKYPFLFSANIKTAMLSLYLYESTFDMDKDSEFSTATLSCLMTMCLPIETGASKLVEELRIASFKIAKNTDSWQRFQERLQTVHLPV